jgi:hypothetical protein
MMMSALKAGGLPLLVDGIRTADANNPKGYYEFEPVKRLAKGDTDWLTSAPGKAVKIISALLEFLPEKYMYRIIFMERDIDEILSSQKRMLARNGVVEEKPVSDEDLSGSYENHLREVKSFLEKQKTMQTLYLGYNDVLQHPSEVFEGVARFLDRSLDTAKMAYVVDPALYRERKFDDSH